MILFFIPVCSCRMNNSISLNSLWWWLLLCMYIFSTCFCFSNAMLTTRWVCIRLSSSVSAQKCTWSRGLKGWVNIKIGHVVFEFNIIISAWSWCIECHGQWHNLPDPAAAQCPQKVYSRMWDRDRENTTNARTPLNKFLQASSDIRYVKCKCKWYW